MTLRQFFDSDNDKIITLMDILYYLRIGIYLFCAVWATLHIVDFSDVQYIAVIAASFGASTFEVFIKSKFQPRSQNNEIITTSGEK